LYELPIRVVVVLQSQKIFNAHDTAQCRNMLFIFDTSFFLGGLFLMFYHFKEKSWSVLLIKGYVSNDQVRGTRCENCKSTTEVLTANHNNPNLLLYGCKDTKCKHRLLRLDFNSGVSKKSLIDNIQTPISSQEAYSSPLVPMISD